MKRPNVLLLTIDTLRADLLGCYGNTEGLTPNLDQLAAEGVRFAQAVTGGSWTQVAFPPLLTSTYGSMYGGCLGRLSPERPSGVELLSAERYDTAAFSTNPHLSRATGYDRGFRYFEDLVPAARDPRLRGLKGGQRVLRNRLIHHAAAPFGLRLRPAPVYTPAASVIDSVFRWLDQTAEPFFGWVHFMDVHWPYHLDETLSRPGDIAKAWEDLAIMHRRAHFKRDAPLTGAQYKRFFALYEEALAYLDVQIGRLLNHLKDSGFDENTVIVVVSDHGEEFMEHGRWGHWESNLHDEIIRVPLIFRLPNRSSSTVIKRLVRTLDLMPTVLDLCKCTAPSQMEGMSLVSFWQDGEERSAPVEAICEMYREPWLRIAVRTQDFNYIWDSKEPGKAELYDLRVDPGELNDVIDHYPEKAAYFRVVVEKHLNRMTETQAEGGVEEVDFDEATVRRLHALGYIE